MQQYGATGYDQQLPPYGYGNAGYGAKPGRQRVGMNIPAMLLTLFVPWLLYTTIAGLLSFSIHYEDPGLCKSLVSLGFIFVILLAYFAWVSWRRKAMGEGEPTWYIVMFLTALVAWIAGTMQGNSNYSHNMRPYYDVISLNVYPSVDPQNYKGQQLMDMGRVTFSTDTRLDLSYSMGFRNEQVYCVAPIVSGNGSMSQYDFWAVGTNCCSGHTSDFACGEFNNPLAHSGLRLMRDDLRPYFRLAVEQAEAAFNIKAVHPIFLYFMQDPIAEINAYQDEGFKQYLFGVYTFFAVQLLITVFAAVGYSKMSQV